MCSYITIDGWKCNMRFSSAHIIPDYEKCGRLHGHTYAVHAKFVGKPDSKGIIIDFTVVKEVLRKVTNELDHKVLIPDKNNAAKIEKQKKCVKIVSQGKEYVFPLEDCVFLPIKSTSAENLAAYILDRIVNKVSLPRNIESIEIGVDEGVGQGARVSYKLD